MIFWGKSQSSIIGVWPLSSSKWGPQFEQVVKCYSHTCLIYGPIDTFGVTAFTVLAMEFSYGGTMWLDSVVVGPRSILGSLVC